LAKKPTMSKEEASQECGRACAIVEEVMMGLFGTEYPAPDKNGIADKLSETKDALDELQSDLQEEAQAARAGK
jgi:hypothetical protein